MSHRDIWKNNFQIQPSSVSVCLFSSTWFPKCNIFQCFRNQTNQGHCSDVKPCPVLHKIQESCIKSGQCTHSFNEEPVMFPHKFIAWELSSAFCWCQNALAFYFLYSIDFFLGANFSTLNFPLAWTRFQPFLTHTHF